MWWLLASCTWSPSVPPDARGVVLFVDDETLVVQHEDLLGRIAPGVERYRTERRVSLGVGDTVDLWHQELVFERASKTGSVALKPVLAAGGHPLMGTVVNIDGNRVMVDHEPIDGVMGAMVMGFGVSSWEAASLEEGSKITGRLLPTDYGWQLVDVEVVGTAPATQRTDVDPLQAGDVLPAFTPPDHHSQPSPRVPRHFSPPATPPTHPPSSSSPLIPAPPTALACPTPSHPPSLSLPQPPLPSPPHHISYLLPPLSRAPTH